MTWSLALSKTKFHLICDKLGSVATVWPLSQIRVCPWCALVRKQLACQQCALDVPFQDGSQAAVPAKCALSVPIQDGG